MGLKETTFKKYFESAEIYFSVWINMFQLKKKIIDVFGK